MKSPVVRIIHKVAREAQSTFPKGPTPPTDLVLDHILAKQDILKLNDAVAFANDVRQAIEPLKCNMTVLKRPKTLETPADSAFVALCDLLTAIIPATPVQLALRYAAIADNYRGIAKISSRKNRSQDVRRHFASSSSNARKGRLLTAAVRAFEPKQVVELGMAYGISGFFIANAQLNAGLGTSARLLTIEAFEPMATLGRELLSSEFGEQVSFEVGLAKESLPRVAAKVDAIDMYFHDAGHTFDDYKHDIDALLPKMASGSVLILDDIRWDDRRYVDQPSRAYEGWQSIVANPRTRAAAEIDGEIGVAVFS